jgi:hypothetical protein
MKMYSKDGNEMMDTTALWREGDNIVMKGKVMQAMNMTIYLRPADVWKSKGLLSWSLLWYLPIIVLKGWWACRGRK